jgi:TonB family protein
MICLFSLYSCGGSGKQEKENAPSTVEVITNIDTAKVANDSILSEKTEQKAENKDDDKIYYFKDLSEISEGADLLNWKEYFRENNRFKDWDSKDEKRVLVKSVIEKNGKASNIEIAESSGNEELDNEAIRLVQEATFSTGKNLKGQPVRSGDFIVQVFFPPK